MSVFEESLKEIPLEELVQVELAIACYKSWLVQNWYKVPASQRALPVVERMHPILHAEVTRRWAGLGMEEVK